MMMLPMDMLALRTTEFGDPDVLQLNRIPIPELGIDDVLIKVSYCGVCRHDVLTRQGAFPYVVTPITQGHQISGTVVASGGDRGHHFIGQAVTTMLSFGCGICESCVAGDGSRCKIQRPVFIGDDINGGYAEYVRLPSSVVIALPSGMDLKIAAVANCTYGTAWHAVVSRGQFLAGETVIVTGASGGVGIHLVRLLAYLKIRCVAVTSRESQVSVLLDNGADEVVISNNGEFAKEAKRRSKGGIAGVIDVVGAGTLNESIRTVQEGGRIVVLGNVDAQQVLINPAMLILREISLLGTKSATREELMKVLSLMHQGELQVNIAGVFPLSQGATVHRMMQDRELSGRALLSPENRT